MGVTAAHIRELTSLGITGETLICVVEIIDKASAASLDMSKASKDKSEDILGGPLESTAERNRKERDKQRKRLKRAAEKAANLSRDMSEDSAVLSEDSVLCDSVLLPSLSSIGEPLKKESKAERMRARGTRMAPDTPLSAEHRALIIAEGISDPEKFWAEFVDYWSEVSGRHGVKIGWTGTLRNRCRDVISKGFNRPSGKTNGRRTVHDAARDLHEDVVRRIAELDAPAPTGLRDGTGQGPLRLLPPR